MEQEVEAEQEEAAKLEENMKVQDQIYDLGRSNGLTHYVYIFNFVFGLIFWQCAVKRRSRFETKSAISNFE